MGITSVSSSQVMRQQQPSQADKEKFAAAAKKAGVNVTEGQRPSDEDLQKLKKAGIDIKA